MLSSTRSPVDGRALEPVQLLSLATFLGIGRDHGFGASAARGRRFRSCARIADTHGLVRARDRRHPRERSIPPARSPTMPARSCRSIRDRLRKQRARLRGTLESYLRGKDTSKYLQQQVVTDRNGRYVLVVRERTPLRDPGHRPRQLRHRREPLPRAAQHRRDQQRHRRAGAAGSGRSPPDPAGAVGPASAAAMRSCSERWRPRPSSTCCRRRRASPSPVDGHRPAVAEDGRLELPGRAAPAADRQGGSGRHPPDPAGERAGRSPGRTPAARPSR